MIKHPFPTLESDRLILRRLQTNDQNEIFRLRSEPGINKYLDRSPAKSIQDAIDFIHRIKKENKDKNWIYWAITLKNEDNLIGTICLWNILEDDKVAEIGFELLPEYQNKGMMMESLTCVLKYGFENLNLHKVLAVIHPENSKSINLLENFHFVQDLDKRPTESDECCYVLNSEGYKLNKD